MLVTIPLGSASEANVPGESPYVYSAGAAAAAAAASGAAPPPPPGGYETPPSALTSYMTGQTGALPSPYGSALYPVDNRYVGESNIVPHRTKNAFSVNQHFLLLCHWISNSHYINTVWRSGASSLVSPSPHYSLVSSSARRPSNPWRPWPSTSSTTLKL